MSAAYRVVVNMRLEKRINEKPDILPEGQLHECILPTNLSCDQVNVDQIKALTECTL